MANGVALDAGDDSGGRTNPLLPSRKPSAYTRSLSRADDELRSFRSCLQWMCVDQSDAWHATASWSLFLLLSIFVPAFSHAVLSYTPIHRAFNAVVQIALSAASILSYLCLSGFVRRYGLRRFLFLDKLVRESEQVRNGYMAQLNRAFHLLSFFVMPCFAGEVVYKIWWYASGSESVPFKIMGSATAADFLACALELASWIYRIAIFFFLCVLFRLLCYLQILRLHDFAGVFGEGSESDVGKVLKEHLRIRKDLKIISHRYRRFILSCLMIVTASQFTSLLLFTHPRAKANLFNAGELALCSIVLVTGLLMCLRGAAKITHKAQAITNQAATWHVCATIECSNLDNEEPVSQTSDAAVAYPSSRFGDDSSDMDDDKDDEYFDVRKLVSSNMMTISFQKRQALVTYLENNKAGITVFGFVVDRAWLHALFMVQLSLVMWLLGKTIGIS